MPSNSEMYARGATDAAQDDLNSFYYQHYYDYRRGYDDARRQQRGGSSALLSTWLLPLLALVGVALLGLVVFWLLILGPRPVPPALTPTFVSTIVSVSPFPVVQPSPSPVATVSPTAPPVLRIGVRVRVANVGDTPLRARAKPGTEQSNRTVARFPQGAEVMITDGPEPANGLIWWRIKGTAGEGWSVGRSAEGLVFLEALP